MDRADSTAGTALTIIDGQAIVRDEARELVDLADAIGRPLLDIAEAATHFADEPEDLAKLSPRAQRIAHWAVLPKSEAPVALLAALDYHKELKRREQASRDAPTNILIQNNNYGVVLPAQEAPALDVDVIIVDSDKLREV